MKICWQKGSPRNRVPSEPALTQRSTGSFSITGISHNWHTIAFWSCNTPVLSPLNILSGYSSIRPRICGVELVCADRWHSYNSFDSAFSSRSPWRVDITIRKTSQKKINFGGTKMNWSLVTRGTKDDEAPRALPQLLQVRPSTVLIPYPTEQ